MPSITQALQFRTPRYDDAERLTALAHAAKRRWGYPEAWIDLWSGSLTVTPANLDEWQFEFAESSGRIFGYFALSLRNDPVWLEHFWVAPEKMGQRYGRQLFQRALWHCQQLGAARLRVVSDPNAEGFYQKLGGTKIAEAPSIPAPRLLPVLEFRIPVER